MMLSKRQKNLISILRDANNWRNSAFLAKELKVTRRTVRNDVSAINYEYPGLIESSNIGYHIPSSAVLPRGLFAADKYSGKDERANYLLSKLLTAKNGLNIYDLADDLFVSHPTIEKDIRQTADKLAEFQLKLTKKDTRVYVCGSEYNRRKMLNNLVYTELNGNLYELINYYRGFYEDVELYTVKRILCEVLTKNNVGADEYSINAIVLHIGIAANRVRNNQIISDEVCELLPWDQCEERKIAEQVAERMGRELKVTFPPEEVYSLAYNMMGKTKVQPNDISSSNLLESVGQDYIEIAKNLLNDVKIAYGLDLYDEKDDTFVRFAFHVRDMIIRMRSNLTIKNPLVGKLKNNYPMIYEIGIYIAGQLCDRLRKHASEEEISFLAIHVGALLENTHNKQTGLYRIPTLLVCPQYVTIQSSILSSLKKRMHDELNIVGVAETIEPDYSERGVEMILTTVNLSSAAKASWQEFVAIKPFPDTSDYHKIEDVVERIRRRKKQEEFAKTTRSWFHKNLFFIDIDCKNEWDAIELMGVRMHELGYVREDFTKEVIRREKLSSTTYGGRFAIPHSMEMNAYISCIAVMVCKKPLKWGEFTVSMVFLIAINQGNRHSFAQFYDTLAGLFIQEANLNSLFESRNYDDFIEELQQEISKQK
jgi:lichenan operon transcriptional antiterminator